MSAYRLSAPPRAASSRSFDCSFCSATELRRPVFLEDGAGVIAAGSGCAAKALGYSERMVVDDAANLARAAAKADELIAERRSRYATALFEFNTTSTGAPAPEGQQLGAARRTYHQCGGAPVLGLFPAFLAEVAASGILPPLPTTES